MKDKYIKEIFFYYLKKIYSVSIALIVSMFNVYT